MNINIPDKDFKEEGKGGMLPAEYASEHFLIDREEGVMNGGVWSNDNAEVSGRGGDLKIGPGSSRKKV